MTGYVGRHRKPHGTYTEDDLALSLRSTLRQLPVQQRAAALTQLGIRSDSPSIRMLQDFEDGYATGLCSTLT